MIAILQEYRPASSEAEIPRKNAPRARAELHYPADGKGACPTLVFSPGGQAESVAGYAGLGRLFAQWGYATRIVAFDNESAVERAGQFSEAVDWLETAKHERVDLKRLVAAGHSRGAYAAVVAAKTDKRSVACLALAPSGPEEPAGENRPAFYPISGDGGDERFCSTICGQAAAPRWQVTVRGLDRFLGPREKSTVLNGGMPALLNYGFRRDARYRDRLLKAEGVAVEREE